LKYWLFFENLVKTYGKNSWTLDQLKGTAIGKYAMISQVQQNMGIFLNVMPGARNLSSQSSHPTNSAMQLYFRFN
jgi:hypothetical protein